ncbi:MAG: WD40 repeat domain-containing protein [Tropicimonas sp.]|uniref:WD40 repeat domain-containing protein n=1 Tax=Tropicimonas sp. TaxID=2067044 RepID=UPI003A8A682E
MTAVPTRLEREGAQFGIDAVPVAAIAGGEAVFTAWGDGRLRLFRPGTAPEEIRVHQGAILSMAQTADGTILTGGDDGLFARTTPEGAEEIARFPRKWVDHVAAGASGTIACAVGRVVHLWEPDGQLRELEHPSSIGGLAFDGKGGRLAVAHYGGVTIWARDKRRWKATRLKWAGSHGRVIWSPDHRFLITSMQENALHGWRLRDKADLRMSGYPAKVAGLDWAGELPWLVTSGAGEAVAWPFDGANGPMGRGAMSLCSMGGQVLVTSVCALPGQEAILAGFADGAIQCSELSQGAVPMLVKSAQGSAITVLAVTSSSGWMFAADDDGRVLWTALAG